MPNLKDLNTPFTDYACPTPDPAGNDIPVRGNDPHGTQEGAQGLKPMWEAPVVPTPGGEETPNSLSGLPLRPARMAPSPAEPPQPPTLKDRSPMTIDEK